MGKMTPIIVENNNHAVAGLYVIILIIYVLYTCASIYINVQRKKKLIRAKELIEEGHDRKLYEEAWEKHEEI